MTKEEFAKNFTKLTETVIFYNNMLKAYKDAYINYNKKFDEDDHVVYKDSNIDYYTTDGTPGVDQYGNILYDIYYWDTNGDCCYEFSIDQDNLKLNEG